MPDLRVPVFKLLGLHDMSRHKYRTTFSLPYFLFSMVFVCTIFSPFSFSAEIEYYLGFSETISSNITKSTDEEFGSSQTFSLGGSGSKEFDLVSFGVDGALTHTIQDDALSYLAQDNQMTGAAYMNFDIIENLFTWNNSISSSQVLLNPFASNRADNLSDVIIFTSKPEFTFRLGSVDEIMVSSALNRYEQRWLYDSQRFEHMLEWRHTLKNGRLSVNATYLDVDNEISDTDYVSRSAYASVLHRFRLLTLSTRLGLTSILYELSGDEIENEIIELKANWKISEKINVNLGFDRSSADSLEEYSFNLSDFSDFGAQFGIQQEFNEYRFNLTKTDNSYLVMQYLPGSNDIRVGVNNINRENLVDEKLTNASNEKRISIFWDRPLTARTDFSFSHAYSEVEFNVNAVVESSVTNLSFNRASRRNLSIVLDLAAESQKTIFGNQIPGENISSFDDISVVLTVRYTGIL